MFTDRINAKHVVGPIENEDEEKWRPSLIVTELKNEKEREMEEGVRERERVG